MEAEKFTLYTVEEYLANEAASEIRHEYLNGTIHAMSGASRRHNSIALNIAKALDRQVPSGPCQTYLSDVKVRVRTLSGDFFYYPDVMVGCDPDDRHEYHLERPTAIFEVTSPSTKPTDRREKLLAYQGIPSLRHYLIVSQSERLVEWFRRDGDAWKRFRLAEPNDALDLRELGATLALSEIYDGIAFGPIPDDDAGL